MVEITEDDYGYDLEFTILDDDDTPINLAGVSSINFLAKKITDTYSLGGSCTVVSPTDGTCKYTVQNTDFTSAGQFIGEVSVVWAAKKLTFGGIDIRVRSKQAVSP